jgi:hypothetical protein
MVNTDEARFITAVVKKVNELHPIEQLKYGKNARIVHPKKAEIEAWIGRNIARHEFKDWYTMVTVDQIALNILHGMEIFKNNKGYQEIYINRPPPAHRPVIECAMCDQPAVGKCPVSRQPVCGQACQRQALHL